MAPEVRFDDIIINDSYDIFSNESKGYITDESQSLIITRLVVQKYLVPFFVTCGIVGNFFNIVVLVNPKMRTSTNVYLMSLAFCDSFYLLVTLTLSFMHCSNKNLPEAAFRYIPFARVFSDLFANTAVWLTVCFTLERYIAVAMPMKGKAWCTVKKAKIAIGIIFLSCFVNTFPEFFETKIVKVYENKTEASWHFNCRYTDFAKTASYQFGYYWWFVAVFTFTPLILLALFNSLLLKTVWEANKKRQELSQSRVTGEAIKQSKEQQRVTMMLISVVLIFLVCQTPQAVLLIYKTYIKAKGYVYPANVIKIAGNICNLLVQINASVNFLLYSYFSSKFRRTFRHVICRCRRGPCATNSMRPTLRNFRQKSTSTTGTTLTSSSVSSYRSRKLNVTLKGELLKTESI
ncbi:hypothetical protein ACF0H5_022847 [Mactra antiquata]